MTFSELDPRTLTALGVEGALEAAGAPRATADTLFGLSAHPDARVRARVASHPNTPVEVLGTLAANFPREVLGNPGLPLMRLARPNLLGVFPAEGVIALLALPEAPGWVLDGAARHEDFGVRTALAARANLSPARVEALAQDAGWQVREAVAKRANLPEPLVRQLAADDDYDVRKAVAVRADLPGDVLRTLVGDGHGIVRASVARRLDLPLDCMLTLATDDDSDVLATLARRVDLPGTCASGWQATRTPSCARRLSRRGGCPPRG